MHSNLSLRLLVLCTAGLLLSGCAAPKYNYSPAVRQLSEPPVGSVATAQVGDTLLRQGVLVEHEVMNVEGEYTMGLIGRYTVPSGAYKKTGENEESNFYATESTLPGAGIMSKNAIADNTKAVQAYKVGNKLCGISVFNAAICTEARFGFAKLAVASDKSFQQSLIYSGKVGNRVRIGYREFSGNLARPAFNNEAEYDMAESKIIGYKGARIEILEATNESIRYRVLANFNLSTASN